MAFTALLTFFPDWSRNLADDLPMWFEALARNVGVNAKQLGASVRKKLEGG